MKNYLKPEIELLYFTTEAITGSIIGEEDGDGTEGGDI